MLLRLTYAQEYSTSDMALVPASPTHSSGASSPGRKEIQERRNEMKSMDDPGTEGKCPHELIILRILTHARTEHGSLMLLLFIPASSYVRVSIRELVMTRYHDRYQARGKEEANENMDV